MEGHAVRIVDHERTPLAERMIGEIECAGPSVVAGYWSENGAESPIHRDGFLATGDLGYTADGCLFVTGRKTDNIICGGRNISPVAVEEVVRELLDFHDFPLIVAVGIPEDERATESLHLIIESRILPPRDHVSLEERIRSDVEDAVGAAGAHVHWVARRQIPRTASGKLQRRLCRRLTVPAPP